MDRLKIKYGTPEYVVKEDSKIVICYLPYSFENWDKRIKRLVSNSFSFEDFNDIIPLYGDYAKIKAVVRCKGNDVFDVQKGKKIALAKAENKVETRVLAILNRISYFFVESALVMKQRMIDSANNIKHNIDYISKF
jgi:hypothetical protein